MGVYCVGVQCVGDYSMITLSRTSSGSRPHSRADILPLSNTRGTGPRLRIRLGALKLGKGGYSEL